MSFTEELLIFLWEYIYLIFLFLYRNPSVGGMFIACMNALDQLKVEGGVDIFQIVRRIKISQSEFVDNAVSLNLFYSQCLYCQFTVLW